MAKRGFILRVRGKDGNWTWLNPDCPMTKRAAKQWELMNRCDGLQTQIWPENEAREVLDKDEARTPS